MPKLPTTQPSASPPDDGKQLGLLLDTSKSMVDEEFRRSDRIEAKGRQLFTSTGALFAVVMATTAGVLNALLDEKKVHGWVYPVLGGTALASVLCLGVALTFIFETQRVHQTDALDPSTLEQYVKPAEKGNTQVTTHLINFYAQALRARRKTNVDRVRNLKRATAACALAATASLLQMASVFLALITK